MKKNKSILAWHAVANDGKLGYADGRHVKAGKTYSIPGMPYLCKSGMHASVRLIDMLNYAPGSLICRVRLSGHIIKGNDKIVATTRKVLWIINAERILHEFACKIAMNALLAERKAGREPDPRSFAAIEAKHKYLNNEITQKKLGAAWRAAESAAWGAARGAAKSAAESAADSAAWGAAESAAWGAAWSAAKSAAWSAAESAAESAADSAAWGAAESAAWGAAWSAAESAQNKLLTKMITQAHKKEVKNAKKK